ncbi:MAG: OadG family protein [Lachnospiraceae bacterium]|nr:OadG family protein [Lachnospiraceae bacterium]
MKKKLMILSLLAVLVCVISGCTKTLPEDFDVEYYTDQSKALTSYILQFTTDETTFNILSRDVAFGFDPDELKMDIDVLQEAFSGTATAIEEAGKPGKSVEAITYDVEGDNVTVTCTVPYEKYNVDYEFTYRPDERAEYNPYVYKYDLMQIVVSTDYPKSELLKMAGMNTLMGMGVVFLALIFIAFVISLFKFLPGSGAKQQKAKEEAKKAAALAQRAKTSATVPEEAVRAADPDSEDLMNDQELVAVITAAVYAASSGRRSVASSDQLIVRSIKRASR